MELISSIALQGSRRYELGIAYKSNPPILGSFGFEYRIALCVLTAGVCIMFWALKQQEWYSVSFCFSRVREVLIPGRMRRGHYIEALFVFGGGLLGKH